METEPFKQFFCVCFKVIHNFSKCWSTFVKSGIISKTGKVRTAALKNQINDYIYVEHRVPNIYPSGKS